MSAPLVVSIPHHLGRDEAVRRLKSGLSRAASSVNVLKVEQESWEGDRMHRQAHEIRPACQSGWWVRKALSVDTPMSRRTDVRSPAGIRRG